MQSKAVLVLSTAFIFASAPVVDAQIYNMDEIPSRFSFGGDFAISQPKGEFANNVPNGYGLDLNGMFKVDPKGYFNIRADVGGVQYGRESPAPHLPQSARLPGCRLCRAGRFEGSSVFKEGADDDCGQP